MDCGLLSAGHAGQWYISDISITAYFKYILRSLNFQKKTGGTINKKTYVVVDIETTGLSPYFHKITEIAALKMRNHKILDEFHSLVNPKTHIPRFITNLTGINDEMVRDAPTINKVILHFNDFLSDKPFVAHNALFDFGFLDQASRKNLKTYMTNDVICTCILARRLLPDLPRKNMAYVCSHFNITNEKAHRAMGDAAATSKILSRFIRMLEEKGLKNYEDLLDIQAMRKKCMPI
ncbi:MAG: exonuclease domain-containing protein [Candidatus Woesearchaeota archaeon]